VSTRRHLIKIIPALPLVGLAGTAGLLSACGKKEAPVAPAAAPPAAPPPPVAATTPEPAAPPGATAGLPLLDEKDPAAGALGYVNDATKTDKAKYPKYADGQNCSNCALYQGAAGSAQGGCPLFPGKNVSAKAWCSAYAKKAA
jgi:High potential iron-sulfur protein